MKRMEPRVLVGIRALANACAHRNEPVVLISSVRFHSAGAMSSACVHPTTPAKQHSIFTGPSSAVDWASARSTCAGSVTSPHIERIRACGKSRKREVIWSAVEEKSRSKRTKPESPCSRRARALTRARVPLPPVTRRKNSGSIVNFLDLRKRRDEICLDSRERGGGMGEGSGENTLEMRRNIRIALPSTAKRRLARPVTVRLGGVGEGERVKEERSPVERTISGRVRLVSSS